MCRNVSISSSTALILHSSFCYCTKTQILHDHKLIDLSTFHNCIFVKWNWKPPDNTGQHCRYGVCCHSNESKWHKVIFRGGVTANISRGRPWLSSVLVWRPFISSQLSLWLFAVTRGRKTSTRRRRLVRMERSFWSAETRCRGPGTNLEVILLPLLRPSVGKPTSALFFNIKILLFEGSEHRWHWWYLCGRTLRSHLSIWLF